MELFVAAPDPIELFAVAPEPMELFVLFPDPIELFVVAPDPIELLVLLPEPIELFTVAPEPIELFVLFPDPIVLFVVAPDPIELLVFFPEPIELFKFVPEPMELLVLLPEPMELLVLLPEPIELLMLAPDPIELSELVTRTISGRTTPPRTGWVPIVSTMSPVETSMRSNNTVAPPISAIPIAFRETATGPSKYTCDAPGTYCPVERVTSLTRRMELLDSTLPVMETYWTPERLFAPQTAAIPSASIATKVIPSTVTVRDLQLARSMAPTAAISKLAETAGNDAESAMSVISGATRDFPRGASGDMHIPFYIRFTVSSQNCGPGHGLLEEPPCRVAHKLTSEH